MRQLSIADFNELTRVSNPRLSPDGRYVAYVQRTPKSDQQYKSSIACITVEGGDPRQLTISNSIDSEPSWSPSGDRIAFVRTRDGESEIWILPVKHGGEAYPITETIGKPSNISWAATGEFISFTQRTTEEERQCRADIGLDENDTRTDPDPRVIDRLVYRDSSGYFDGQRHHIYTVNPSTEQTSRLTEGDYDHYSPSWSDSETIYYLTKRTGDPDDNIIYDIVAHPIDGEPETVGQTTTLNPSLTASSDGRIAYITQPAARASLRQQNIEVYSSTDGSTTTVTSSLDRTIHGGVQWGPADEFLYFLTPNEGKMVVQRVPADGSSPAERICDGVNHVLGFDVGEQLTALIDSRWDHPGDVYIFNENNRRRLTQINGELLGSRQLAEPESIRFRSADGTEIHGWILRPPNFDAAETYPSVVKVHGGPHHLWTTSGRRWHEFQFLANCGFVVFWCNPRGSIGRGEAFAGAVERDWGGVDYRDLISGVNHLCERDYIDEEYIFITGGSYGAHLGAWALAHSDRFRAAALTRGGYDRLSFYGTSSTGFKSSIEMEFDTVPWEEPELLWNRSPVAHVEDITAPTLLMHGDNDFIVPASGSEIFYRYLKKTGTETRYVQYPREGHNFPWAGEPAHIIDHLERTVDWFKRVIDGESPTQSDKE